MIDIALIDAHNRLRKADPERVAALSESMAEVGLLNPVTVCRATVIRDGYKETDGFRLIAGGHRLEAAKILGWKEIAANVVDLDDHQAVIAECDENLCVNNLSPADRAMFTAKRKAAYEALHPETAHGHNTKESGTLCHSSFADDQADKTGRAARTVRRDAEIGAKLSDQALGLIRGTKLDNVEYLKSVKDLTPPEQERKVREDLTEVPAARTDEEIATEQAAKVLKLWNRISPRARELVLAEIDQPVLGDFNPEATEGAGNG